MELEEGASEAYQGAIKDGGNHEAVEASFLKFFKSKKFAKIANEAYIQIRPA